MENERGEGVREGRCHGEGHRQMIMNFKGHLILMKDLHPFLTHIEYCLAIQYLDRVRSHSRGTTMAFSRLVTAQTKS